MSLLEVTDLSVGFHMPGRDVQVVDKVSFSLEKGEILAVVGESGSGKTQTAFALIGLLAKNGYASGSVKVDGQELIGLSEAELNKVRAQKISIIFQDPMTSLNPYVRISEQLIEVLVQHKRIGRGEALTEAHRMLDAVKLPNARDIARRYPHELSGGMRQRVMIAMALLCQPKILIADEPTTALDVIVQKNVLDMIREIQQAMGSSVLLVTHDLGVHAHLADRLGIMYAGRLVEEGPTREVFAAPRHPYTAHLVASLPRIGDTTPRKALEGSPPNLAAPPSGCRFHPRCPLAMERCRSEVPAMVNLTPMHRAACFAIQP